MQITPSILRRAALLGASAALSLLFTVSAPSAFAAYGFTAQDYLVSDFGSDSLSTQDREPDLATDGAGVWIAVWTQSGFGDAEIHWSRSTDNGLTWSGDLTFNSNAATDSGDDAEPAIATDGAGNWIVVWSSNDDLGGTVGSDTDIFYSRSTDNGFSWSAVAPLNAHATTDNVTFSADSQPDIACDGADTWVVAWVSEAAVLTPAGPTDPEILAIRSTDDGATWGAAALASPLSATDTDFEFSPTVACGGSNVWMVFSVSPASAFDLDNDYDLWHVRSTDNAATWSTSLASISGTASVTQLGAAPCSLANDGAGTWLAVWGTDDGLFDVNASEGDIVFAKSTDNGATWTSPVLIDSSAGTDTPFDSTPTITWNAATDEWGVVWQSQEIGAEDLKFAASYDDGTSWETAQTVSNTGGGQEKVPVIEAGLSGVWMIVWESNDGFFAPISDDDIMAIRSALLPVELSGFALE